MITTTRKMFASNKLEMEGLKIVTHNPGILEIAGDALSFIWRRFIVGLAH